jgi:BirA family transcriptional regulator, biotin operon repressor / biotin---[acetyl-CoA-carboxylase] ligase
MSEAVSGDLDAGSPPVSRLAEDESGVPLPTFYQLRRHRRLGSTNDEAKALAENGAAAGTLVWAREQTRGHGRQGRPWVSPPGNLYASILLRPHVSAGTATQLGFVAALAVRDACLEFAPDAAITFKWPNDVLLEGRKLAGILLESQMQGDGRLAWLVLGIGINLATYPVATDYPATALSACGAEAAPEAMLGALARRFLERHTQWRDGEGFAALRAEWLAHAQGLGQAIRVRLPRATLAGTFAGLDNDGALLLDTERGGRRVEAGEVFPAAPPS